MHILIIVHNIAQNNDLAAMKTMKTIEKRKRRSEEYACDEERKVVATRAKLDAPYRWNQEISNGMRDDIGGEDFLSKIPPHVLLEFVRERSDTFGAFLNARNSRVYTPDITWIAETTAYQKHASLWLERKIDGIRKGLVPFKTLRDYRSRNLPLRTACIPFNPFRVPMDKVFSLPSGSYVFVKQVLCKYAKVYMSTSGYNEDGHVSLTIEQAWEIVAGPQLFFHTDMAGFNQRLRVWNATPCEPHTFQHALLRILEDCDTMTALPIDQNADPSLCLKLVCGICPDAYERSIQFHFSADCVQRYDAIIESCDFPAGVNTCIAGYL
jgi:hypothetical protein